MKGRVAVLGLACCSALACDIILGIGPVPDASDDGAEGGVDAGPMCDPKAPFASVDPVASLSGPNIIAVTLSPDQKTAFLCKYNATVARTALYVQTRLDTTSDFGQAALLLDHACAASISADHKRFFYEYDDYPDGSSAQGDRSQIFVFQVFSDAGNALALVDAGTNSGNGPANTPFLLANDDGLYLKIFNAGPGPGIYRASIPQFDTSTKVKNVSPFATAPVLTPDELVLYYSEGNALSVSVRSATTQDFPDGTPLRTADAGGETIAPAFVSQDRCTVYYAVIDGMKAAQVFVGHRNP